MYKTINNEVDIKIISDLLGDFQMSFAENIVFDSNIRLLPDGSIGYGTKDINSNSDSFKPNLKMIIGSESANLRIEFIFEDVFTFDYTFDSKMDNWNFLGGKISDLITRFKLETTYFVITSKTIKYRIVTEN